jgi:hypothetical protein
MYLHDAFAYHKTPILTAIWDGYEVARTIWDRLPSDPTSTDRTAAPGFLTCNLLPLQQELPER